MMEAIDRPDEMSPFAPRIISIQIPVDKIGEVIGPKGKMINQIQDETGAEITIQDDGTIYIGATDGPKAEAARAQINAIANPHMPEIGERYLGTVVKTTTFGAFISLMPGKDGLLHISKLRSLAGGKRVENVDDVVSIGQKVLVEITEIDARGKLSLSPVEEGDDRTAASSEEPAEVEVEQPVEAERPAEAEQHAEVPVRRPVGGLAVVFEDPAGADAYRVEEDGADGGGHGDRNGGDRSDD
jgi:polyribonucleotide nucleotidyltransferase